MLVEGSERAADSRDDLLVPAAVTDTGCERDLNEDRYAVIESPSGLAWVVCDGMGGVTGGELAAQIAIDAIRRDLENLPARPSEAALRSAVLEANRVIVLRRQNQAFAQMGTTIVAALFNGPEVVIGHVGDSRAYLIRDGAIQQLTTDHTYVQELVDKGQIRPEEALSHPQAHVLTRAIGAEPGINVDTTTYWTWSAAPGEPDDFLLLCSDGLYSMIEEGEVANIISQETPQQACVRLVELAKDRGGFDNITLAIIPLNGQLRKEMPPDIEARLAEHRRRTERARPVAQRDMFGFLRLALTIVALTAMSVLLVFLIVMFQLSR